MADHISVKPFFKEPEGFMVVRSGNSIRIKINYEVRVHTFKIKRTLCIYLLYFLLCLIFKMLIFNIQASPMPEIRWLKNGEPVSPWNQIINTDGTSTLVVPSSKYSDSGVYNIVAKNSSGQTSFDIEVRVAGIV